MFFGGEDDERTDMTAEYVDSSVIAYNNAVREFLGSAEIRKLMDTQLESASSRKPATDEEESDFAPIDREESDEEEPDFAPIDREESDEEEPDFAPIDREEMADEESTDGDEEESDFAPIDADFAPIVGGKVSRTRRDHVRTPADDDFVRSTLNQHKTRRTRDEDESAQQDSDEDDFAPKSDEYGASTLNPNIREMFAFARQTVV